MQGKNILELFPESADYLNRKINTALVIESSSFSGWEQKPHLLPFKVLAQCRAKKSRCIKTSK